MRRNSLRTPENVMEFIVHEKYHLETQNASFRIRKTRNFTAIWIEYEMNV